MRGTNIVYISRLESAIGSPPLARDKYSLTITAIRMIRITPACAGQIFFGHMLSDIGLDHPRLRGTNILKLDNFPCVVGSPPLARDKLRSLLLMMNLSGITPACAGQIMSTSKNGTSKKDHPRLRGTNKVIFYAHIVKQGSPPLARDKFCSCLLRCSRIGITPACAGQILKDLIILSHLFQLFAKSI